MSGAHVPACFSTSPASLQTSAFVLVHWVFKMIEELWVDGPGAKSLSLWELRLSGCLCLPSWE